MPTPRLEHNSSPDSSRSESSTESGKALYTLRLDWCLRPLRTTTADVFFIVCSSIEKTINPPAVGTATFGGHQGRIEFDENIPSTWIHFPPQGRELASSVQIGSALDEVRRLPLPRVVCRATTSLGHLWRSRKPKV